ncbi:MAG: hypothetical protein Q4D02_07255 [Clostridia bacterium]|nr:hypothetical protein [Clostridia bacterium]
MFDKLKKAIKNMGKGFEYICDVNTIFTFMKKELEFSMENNLEAVANFNLYYHEEKYKIVVWNFAASDVKSEQEKGLSVTLNDVEYHSIDNFIDQAMLGSTLIKDIKEELTVELLDMDSDFLNKNAKRKE